MSPELISITVLGAMFVIATLLPINMGVLGFAGAFVVGTLVAGLSASEIIAGFPAGLFLTLVGITYLFAIGGIEEVRVRIPSRSTSLISSSFT